MNLARLALQKKVPVGLACALQCLLCATMYHIGTPPKNTKEQLSVYKGDRIKPNIPETNKKVASTTKATKNDKRNDRKATKKTTKKRHIFLAGPRLFRRAAALKTKKRQRGDKKTTKNDKKTTKKRRTESGVAVWRFVVAFSVFFYLLSLATPG